jgi:hypothetical protein
MSKFLNHLNNLLGSMSIRNDEAQLMADDYSKLSDSKKSWIDGNFKSYDSIDEIKKFLKDGAEETNIPLSIEDERDMVLKTLSNNVARIESSVSTISGILIFFTIIWVISVAILIYNLN